MPTLTTIPDLARRLYQAERRVHGHPILHGVLEGAEGAIVKLREHGLCEVLGYQLAGLLGVPVARNQGFWTVEAVETPLDRAGPGRIGILVEFHADYCPITLEEFVEIDRPAGACFLALCLFDRHEWGECALVGGLPIVVDLERVLPGVIPDMIGAAGVDEEYPIHCARDYMRQSPDLAAGMIDEARRLGLLDQVQTQLRRLQRTIDSAPAPFFRLDPHPLGAQICTLAETALRVRLKEGLRQLAAP
jgi:hypothetical protein